MKTESRKIVSPAKQTVSTVAIYTRVSSLEQAQHGVSLSEQKQRLEQWANLQGWNIAGIYTDDGYTGGDDQRPELHRLMDDAKAGLFNIVLVSKIDRFFRNTRQLLNYIYTLESYGVTFVSQSEGIDTAQPGIGKVLLSTLGSFAEMERSRIGERVQDFRTHLKNKNQWSSGRTPYGYRFDKKSKELIIEPVEAESVRFIFNTYTKDQIGIIRTAEICNKQGLETPRFGKRKHTTWTQSTIGHVLRHPAYKGGPNADWTFKTPAIITPELWETAQRQLNNNRHFRESKNKSPFQGLMRCGLCGHTLRIGYNHNISKSWECPGRLKRLHLDNSPRCQLPRFEAEKLENTLIDQIKDIFSKPDTILKYINNTLINLKKEQSEIERQLRPIVADKDKLQEQMSKADTMFQVGRLTPAEYKTRINGIQSKIRELDRQTGDADPMLVKKFKDNEKAIQYYSQITEWIAYVRKDNDTEEKRIKRNYELAKQGRWNEMQRGEPILNPEALNLMSKLSTSAKTAGEKPAWLLGHDLTWLPSQDLIYNPNETAGQYLRRLGLYCYIYPDKIEIKGAIRQSNISPTYNKNISLPIRIEIKNKRGEKQGLQKAIYSLHLV